MKYSPLLGAEMAQIGSEQKPIRMSPRRKTKISGQYLKHENHKKYAENYDRIFKNKESANGSR